jgi:hypothetical protein
LRSRIHLSLAVLQEATTAAQLPNLVLEHYFIYRMFWGGCGRWERQCLQNVLQGELLRELLRLLLTVRSEKYIPFLQAGPGLTL